MLGLQGTSKPQENGLHSLHVDKLRENSDLSVAEMMRDLDERFGLQVDKNTCYSVKALARELIRGSLDDRYRIIHPIMQN